jgi:hypothetical protein
MISNRQCTSNPIWSNEFMTRLLRFRKYGYGMFAAHFGISVAFAAIVTLGGCGSSSGALRTSERMSGATCLRLMPGANLFESLTAYESVSFSSDQLASMGFPASVTITDANTILQFAQLIKDLDFKRTSRDYPRTIFSTRVVAYHDDEAVASFESNGDMLYVPGFGCFRTKEDPQYVQREFRRILPYGQQMENVVQRSSALRLLALTLKTEILSQENGPSVMRDRWCDAVVEFASTHVENTMASLRDKPQPYGFETSPAMIIQREKEFVAAIRRVLLLDGNGSRHCPFALNSQYGENPQEDTVLLFETELVWNGIGGPELLLERSADPNGCFVYLNELGVKFITK